MVSLVPCCHPVKGQSSGTPGWLAAQGTEHHYCLHPTLWDSSLVPLTDSHGYRQCQYTGCSTFENTQCTQSSSVLTDNGLFQGGVHGQDVFLDRSSRSGCRPVGLVSASSGWPVTRAPLRSLRKKNTASTRYTGKYNTYITVPQRLTQH